MKPSNILAAVTVVCQTVSAVAVPSEDGETHIARYHSQPVERDETLQEFWKRRGGGGGGSRGGGGSSSGGSRGGGSSSGGSGTPRGSSSSNTGGATRQGSGPQPSIGGGAFYGGGARQPFSSGSRSPSGIAPLALGAGVGGAAALAFWPGIWYHPVAYYPYTHPYTYHNRSSDKNETRDVACGCDSTVECSCDENGNSTYMRELVGDGDPKNFNKSLLSVADVNGTQTLLINGTLPNGTTASGGDEDAFSAAAGLRTLAQHAGWWPVVATVAATVYFL